MLQHHQQTLILPTQVIVLVQMEHLLKLGVKVIELLPVQGFIDESFFLERGLKNFGPVRGSDLRALVIFIQHEYMYIKTRTRDGIISSIT